MYNAEAQSLIKFSGLKTFHTYAVEIDWQGGVAEVRVDANGRAQARRIAERAGLTVRSVNMVG